MSPVSQPVLMTDRLILRPFTLDDAPELASRLNNLEITRKTFALPYPYEEQHAVEWISTHRASLDMGSAVNYAVTLKSTHSIAGGVSFTSIDSKHRNAEIGYWIAPDCWNQGYATEACQALLDYGFDQLSLHRIQGRHFDGNPASGRVLQKLGMQKEGISRHAAFRAGTWCDLVNYAILETDPRP